MDILQRTVKLLAEAETGLAALASEEARGHRYEAAACLIDLARDVASLASKARAELDSNGRGSVQAGQSLQGSGGTIGATSQSSPKTRPKKGEFPKFFRVGDRLVKLGWSPSEKAEYEHRSPKKVLSLLVDAIGKAGVNGRRFSMDKVLPVADPTDGSRIPDYQVYLCLAWLKALGFLIQHGRKGYSLTTKAPIEPLIETHWTALRTR